MHHPLPSAGARCGSFLNTVIAGNHVPGSRLGLFLDSSLNACLPFLVQCGVSGTLQSVQKQPGYGVSARQVQEFYPLSKTSIAALGPILPLVQWVPEFCSGGKAAGT